MLMVKEFSKTFSRGLPIMSRTFYKWATIIVFLVAVIGLLLGIKFEGILANSALKSVLWLIVGAWLGLTVYLGQKDIMEEEASKHKTVLQEQTDTHEAALRELKAGHEAELADRDRVINSFPDERYKTQNKIEELEQQLRRIQSSNGQAGEPVQ